jgi:hypothetical protein
MITCNTLRELKVEPYPVGDILRWLCFWHETDTLTPSTRKEKHRGSHGGYASVGLKKPGVRQIIHYRIAHNHRACRSIIGTSMYWFVVYDKLLACGITHIMWLSSSPPREFVSSPFHHEVKFSNHIAMGLANELKVHDNV